LIENEDRAGGPTLLIDELDQAVRVSGKVVIDQVYRVAKFGRMFREL
jgi:hypothetical protein